MSSVNQRIRMPVTGPQLDEMLLAFYRVPRAGAVRLSDGGGPFGFDITVAIQFDFAVSAYECDGIIETGCFLGDTTEYLAHRYPELAVVTCDVVDEHSRFTRRRLADMPNVTVMTGDSATLLPEMLARFTRPIVYLDAHWYEPWPLRAELTCVERGVVCVDDFFIGHPRFASDVYNGRRCDPELVALALPELEELYVGNPYASYGVPCLQVGRRCGTAFIPRGLDGAILASSELFARVPLRPETVMPDWSSCEQAATAGLEERRT